MEADDIERYLAELRTRTKKSRYQEASSYPPDRRRVYAPARKRAPFHQRHRHLLARPESTFLHSKSPPDARKTLMIVLYYSRKQKFEHVNKPNKY